MPFVKQAEIKLPQPSALKGLFQSFSSKAPDAPTALPLPDATKYFVGRASELNSFASDILLPGAPLYNILSVCGQSGIGKTQVLGKFIERAGQPPFDDYCLPAYINGWQTTIADIIDQFAKQLRLDGDFRKAQELYKRIELNLQDPKEATREAIVHTVADAATNLAPSIPGGQVVSALAKPAIGGASGKVITGMQVQSKIKDADLAKNAVPELTRAFVDGLNRLTATLSRQAKRNQRVLLFFDTFDKQASIITPWLLNTFLPMNVSQNIVLVIASRQPLDQYTADGPNDWGAYLEQEALHSMPLQVFTESEASEYLAKRGNLDPTRVLDILEASQGLPEFLSLIANKPNVNPTATIVDNILEGIPDEDPKKRLSLSGSHFSRAFNRDDMDAFQALPEKHAFLTKDNAANDGLFSWLTKRDFVQSNWEGYYRYVDYVQELFNRREFKYSKERYYATRQVLAAYYEQQLKSIEDQQGVDAFATEEWANTVRALVYQLFLLPDMASATKAIEYALLALIHFSEEDGKALQAGMLQRLAREIPDEQIIKQSRQAARMILQLIAAELSSQDFAEAAKYLLSRIEIDPTCPPPVRAWLYRDLGIGEVQRSDYVAAIEHLSKAGELDPEDELVYVNRGTAYLSIGEYPEAIADLDVAVTKGYPDERVHSVRGLAYLALGDIHKALDEFNTILNKQPMNALALTLRGMVRNQSSEYAAAIGDLNKAIAINPSLSLAYGYRGMAYLSLHESHLAIKDLTTTLNLSPAYYWGFLNRGLAFAFMNERDLAIADLDRGLALTPDPLKAFSYATRGFAYTFLNMPQESLEASQQALALAPNLLEAHNARGFAYNALSRPQEAIKDFNFVLEHAPMFTWAYVGRGQANSALNRPQEAILDFDRAIALVPRLSRAYAGRGLAYAALYQLQQAMDDCNRALMLDDKDAQAYAARGLVNAIMENAQEAIEDCTRALQLAPNALETVTALIGLGQARGQLGQIDAAIDALNKALAFYPNYALAYAVRGGLNFLAGRLEEARKDCEYAIALSHDLVLAYLALGLTLSEFGEPQNAIESLNHAVDLAPQIAYVYVARGAVYLDMEDYQHAIDDLDKVVALTPSLEERIEEQIVEAYYGRADQRCSQGDYRLAIEDYNRVLQLQPDNTKALVERAYAYAALQDYAHAIEDYTKTLDLTPDDITTCFNRAIAYLNNGGFEKAVGDFTKVIQSLPDDVESYANRAVAYYNLKEYQKAFDDASHALEKQPDDVWLLSLRAVVDMQLHLYEQARVDYAHYWQLEKDDPNAGWMAEWLSMCSLPSAPGATEAEQLEGIAAASEPEHYASLNCKGAALYLRGQLQEAEDMLQRAIAKEAGEWDAYFWMGLVHATLKKDDEAKVSLDKALELNIPPGLLAPLRWLEKENPAFYQNYVSPLLASHHV